MIDHIYPKVNMMQKSRTQFEEKVQLFVKDWERSKCLDGSMQGLIKQYSMEVCWIALNALDNCKIAYVSYPNGPFNHLRTKIANDNNDSLHAPEMGDIVIWNDGGIGIVVYAKPWDTWMDVFAQPLWSSEIFTRSYESILWRLRPNYRHAELAELKR